MNFKDYCKTSSVERDRILSEIKKYVYQHIIKFVREQVISVGNSEVVSFENMKLNEIIIGAHCCKVGSLIHVEAYVGNNIHESLINPKYFKPDNTKNYLREFEINVKDIISEIRKNHSSSSS
jgi:hypothetical protein